MSSALTERQLLQGPPRCLRKHEVDKCDLERNPDAIASIVHYPHVGIRNDGLHDVVFPAYRAPSLRQSNKVDDLSRERTCNLDSNRIHELDGKPCNAAPPLVDGNTPSPSMEGKKLNQKSYPFRQEETHDERCPKAHYTSGR